MYRYGDGTPFPLDENFIETLTSAVESCTNAFVPLTELDNRRARAREARREAEAEETRLDDLERTITGALAAYLAADKKVSITQAVAQKLGATGKQTLADARRQLEARVRSAEAQAQPRTVTDALVAALRPFFDAHQLPGAQWIMSWDVRGPEPRADAVASSGRLSVAFRLSPDPYRAPIRVDQLAEGIVVHMLKKGVFGKAKPAPVDLGRYVMVAFEKSATGQLVVSLKESLKETSPGLRFAVNDQGATWVTLTPAGDADGDENELDADDLGPVRTLAERASTALADLMKQRALEEVFLDGKAVAELEEPRDLPMEILAQLTPLARTIRQKSRTTGELVLKRDIGDGRREELFVPRATLAQQFARLPAEYRRPFEQMGITAEETLPAIQLPVRPPPPPVTFETKTLEYKDVVED